MRFKFIIFILSSSLSLYGDQFAFSFYNDAFVGTDKHFTNALSFSWINKSYNNHDDNVQLNSGISLSQTIITPADMTQTEPQYDDMPYAGHLSLDFFLFESTKESFKEFRVGFGVVGKESGAEFIQKTVHQMLAVTKPQGWDTQLKTKYTTNLLLRYGEITWEDKLYIFNLDWFNHIGLNAGSFITDGFVGTMFRVGYNYRRNFNLHYPYLKEEASLLKISKYDKEFGYSLSFGLNSELLLYSYIFDEAKKEGYQTDKNLINNSFYLGADLYYLKNKLTLFYRSQSKYTNQQGDMNRFGGLLYSYSF